jgi:hypothetical protein
MPEPKIIAAQKYLKDIAEKMPVENYSLPKLEKSREQVCRTLVDEFCLEPEEVDQLLDDQFAEAMAELVKMGDPLGLAEWIKLRDTQDAMAHGMEMIDFLRQICAFKPMLFDKIDEAISLRKNSKSPRMQQLLQLLQEINPVMRAIHENTRPFIRKWVAFCRANQIP